MSAILAMGLTACQEDTSDLGIMQKNPAPEIVAANGVATAFIVGSELDLNNYQNIDLPVMDVAMNADFPENAVLEGTVQISDKDDFANVAEIPYTSLIATSTRADDAVENPTRKFHAVVEGNAFENAFVKLFGRAPFEHTCYVRYNVIIKQGTQENIIEYQGQPWWPSYTVDVTPVDLQLGIYDSYTLFGPFIGDGTPAQGMAMIHNDNNHPWDDPVFSAIFGVSEEQAISGYTLQICPTENTSEKLGVMAGYEANGKIGRLAIGGQPIVVDKAGPYKIEVNMETLMYKITDAYSQLYVPCSGNNWNFTRSCQWLLSDNYINYSGFAYINGTFAFSTQNNVKGTNFIKGEGVGKLLLSDAGQLNPDIALPQPGSKGLYWVTADIVKLEYTAKKITSLGLVGTMNNWGGEEGAEEIKLKAVTANPTAYTVWKGEVTFKAGDKFKVRADGKWDINLGGDMSDLSMGGADIEVAEAGTYSLELNLSGHPWKITLTKK